MDNDRSVIVPPAAAAWGCPGCGAAEGQFHRPRCPDLRRDARGALTCESCFGAAEVLNGVSFSTSGYSQVCGNCLYWRWGGAWDARPRPMAEVEATPRPVDDRSPGVDR